MTESPFLYEVDRYPRTIRSGLDMKVNRTLRTRRVKRIELVPGKTVSKSYTHSASQTYTRTKKKATASNQVPRIKHIHFIKQRKNNPFDMYVCTCINIVERFTKRVMLHIFTVSTPSYLHLRPNQYPRTHPHPSDHPVLSRQDYPHLVPAYLAPHQHFQLDSTFPSPPAPLESVQMP